MHILPLLQYLCVIYKIQRKISEKGKSICVSKLELSRDIVHGCTYGRVGETGDQLELRVRTVP